MYCKYLSKTLQNGFKCKKHKRYIISLNQCENCSDFILVTNKPIKNRSTKQNKIEKNRYSIFTNDFKHCFYCGRETKTDLHEVWGGSNRKRSIKNGFVIPLCRSCHSNEKIILELRKTLQKEYEKTHTRQEFIDIIGKSSI